MITLYNSLTRSKEEFTPINPPHVSLYTCGPTVYDYQHIGNWRTFVFEDILRRTLEKNNYKVNHVMNATDVGHLSGDNLGDADTGEDKMEKGAKREKKNVWDVAQFYLDDFVQTREWLNILPPAKFVRATEFIQEQIALIQKLLDKDLAYETETGVFFSVDSYPEYGKLSGQKLVDKRVASREEVEEDKLKKNPADFALWFKTVGKFADHQMRWPAPWGEGFPGWHIECSAMAMSLLGEQIDIHTGGVDHVAIHHTNEIAQSEGATGKPFAKYWMHGEFLMVDGGRMGKSLGNAYTLHDIKGKGFDLLALRYLYLGAHYRDKLNFTWDSLEAAQTALVRLRNQFIAHSEQRIGVEATSDTGKMYLQKFMDAINNDLNTPQALAVVWEAVKSDLPQEAKRSLLLGFDKVLGLGLETEIVTEAETSQEVQELVSAREEARREGDFAKADQVRQRLENLGYTVKDTKSGPLVVPKV
ncbi:MAG: cysteinyl-tRNA synthetase [Microgenomates group bacterium Gr01-1014_5]|nr:MAG: cysteinyl-tRNA synthetase [Microgenomates group bacterium Gr01-1014_5]